MENKEALQTIRLVCHSPDLVNSDLNLLLADGVVTPGVVVGGVLLASDQLLGVEELPVGAHPDLIHHSGLQVHQDGPGDVLPGAGLGEEGVEAVISLVEMIRLAPVILCKQ